MVVDEVDHRRQLSTQNPPRTGDLNSDYLGPSASAHSTPSTQPKRDITLGRGHDKHTFSASSARRSVVTVSLGSQGPCKAWHGPVGQVAGVPGDVWWTRVYIALSRPAGPIAGVPGDSCLHGRYRSVSAFRTDSGGTRGLLPHSVRSFSMSDQPRPPVISHAPRGLVLEKGVIARPAGPIPAVPVDSC
jgi:hypothetical protein